jgi:hypothetical protein
LIIHQGLLLRNNRRFAYRHYYDAGVFKNEGISLIMKTMETDSLLRYLSDESEEWERLLNFLKQENVFSKSRLAEIVASIEDEDELTKAEQFNDDFIAEDEIIAFLEGELKKHHKLFEKRRYQDEEMLKQLIRQQSKLRMDVRRAEEIFVITKRKFGDFIAELV